MECCVKVRGRGEGSLVIQPVSMLLQPFEEKETFKAIDHIDCSPINVQSSMLPFLSPVVDQFFGLIHN